MAAAEGSSGPAARAEDRVERAMLTAVGVGIGVKVGVAALGRVAGGSSVAASVATAAMVACERAAGVVAASAPWSITGTVNGPVTNRVLLHAVECRENVGYRETTAFSASSSR